MKDDLRAPRGTSASVCAALVVTAWVAPALGADPNPCSLLTTKEIASALGSTPSGGKPAKPSVDKELGAKGWSCDYSVGKSYLSIVVIEFTSATGGAKGMKVMMKEAEEFKLAPAPGLGDQSVWGASAEGALWATLKGKHLLSVTLAGELKDPPRFREPIKRLATLALGRLTP
jgi:hypothetical protein